jgi:hypothetical protein
VDLVLQVDYYQEAIIHTDTNTAEPSRVRKSNSDEVTQRSSVSVFVVPHTVHSSAQVSFHHLLLLMKEIVVLEK